MIYCIYSNQVIDFAWHNSIDIDLGVSKSRA